MAALLEVRRLPLRFVLGTTWDPRVFTRQSAHTVRPQHEVTSPPFLVEPVLGRSSWAEPGSEAHLSVRGAGGQQ